MQRFDEFKQDKNNTTDPTPIKYNSWSDPPIVLAHPHNTSSLFRARLQPLNPPRPIPIHAHTPSFPSSHTFHIPLASTETDLPSKPHTTTINFPLVQLSAVDRSIVPSLLEPLCEHDTDEDPEGGEEKNEGNEEDHLGLD
jgi:hypothetical protein